ncbi:uridine kinase [Calditrichota bacterium]
MQKILETNFPLEELLESISISHNTNRSFLIAIDGQAGAGKSTFTARLVNLLLDNSIEATIVPLDNFFKTSSQRRQIYAVISDLDWRRMRDQVILPLRSGKRAHFQYYSWVEDRLLDWITVESPSVVIVDGVTALRKELAEFYDLRIWLSCPDEVRLPRLSSRADMRAGEIKRWLPSERRYLKSHNPASRADLIIDNSSDS